MDAHRDIGEAPEGEWERVLRYARVLARRQWRADGMITGEDAYMAKAMDAFCRCWVAYEPTKGTFATFFWNAAHWELRHFRSRFFRAREKEAIGVKGFYPRSGSTRLDDSPIMWAQVLARISDPRHRAFVLRLLGGERAAEIARDEGYCEATMIHWLRRIAREVGRKPSPGWLSQPAGHRKRARPAAKV